MARLAVVAFAVALGWASLTGVLAAPWRDAQSANGSVTAAGALRPIEVQVDVKPGVASRVINLRRERIIPVAILATPAFDAAAVVPRTVCFGDAEEPRQRDCTETHGRGHLEDVDRDGDIDLLLHYEAAEAGIDLGDTRACLTGETSGRRQIAGCDQIVTSR